LIAVVPLALTLAACSSPQTVCAGQCHSPYELDVFFHAGVSQAKGTQVLKGCEHLAGVIRISWDISQGPGFGVVWTTFFENSPKAAPLGACLKRSPLVTGQGWPD